MYAIQLVRTSFSDHSQRRRRAYLDMSFIKHKLSVDTLDAPEFPNFLPIDTQVNVPFPVNHHPAYTTYPCAGVDIPDTFGNLINLPDARLEPGLYAAAVNTISQTNWYFEVVGQYRKTGWPLIVKLVRQKQRELSKNRRAASGSTVRRWPLEFNYILTLQIFAPCSSKTPWATQQTIACLLYGSELAKTSTKCPTQPKSNISVPRSLIFRGNLGSRLITYRS